MDIMQDFVLLFPCFTCFFWGITLLCNWSTSNRPQRIWTGGFFVLAISTGIWGIYFAGVKDYGLFYKLEVIEAVSVLLLLPMLYASFKSLTNERQFGWKLYAWFLPALLIGTTMIILYSMMGEQQAIQYIRTTIEHNGAVQFTNPVFQLQHFIGVYVYGIVVFLQLIIILIYATVRLVHYRHRLRGFFSNLDGKSIEHSNVLLICVYLILVMSLLMYRGRFHYDGDSPIIRIHMVAWAVLIYVMGYNVSRLKYAAESLASELEQGDREAIEQGFVTEDKIDADIRRKVSDELIARFDQLIDEDRIYLQSSLRLDDVARIMRTNRTYISRLINEEHNSSFSDYINGKRIGYAQQLMDTDPDLTQENIAERSGFLRATSFSRIFKQQTGMTFREWQRRDQGK